MSSLDDDKDDAIDGIYMYTDLNDQESNEWEGTSRVIKRSIVRLQVDHSKRFTALERELKKYGENITS